MEQSNFVAEVPARRYSGQVVQVNINTDGCVDGLYLWREVMTVAHYLFDVISRIHIPSLITRKTSDKPQVETVYEIPDQCLSSTGQGHQNKESLSDYHSQGEPRRRGS